MDRFSDSPHQSCHPIAESENGPSPRHNVNLVGKKDGQIVLIDEIHTPDSSRYFYRDGYAERQERGEKQKQLSKEFVREWLMENGFQGLEGQRMPVMPDAFVEKVSERYIELYERLTGQSFIRAESSDILSRIEHAIMGAL